MKEVLLNEVQDAAQLTVGLKMNGDTGHVIIGLERMPGAQGDAHWRLYAADAPRAREIAQSLLEGADIAEGKVSVEDVDNAREVEGFHEHG